MTDRTKQSNKPGSPWCLSMRWHDVLFLHWPVSGKSLRSHIPDRLEIETFGGTAWLGIVPFTMSGIRPRFLPPLPVLSAFPEINLRTYVTDGRRSGVWFFSLDASSWLAVKAARFLYALDYYRAEMNVRHTNGTIEYFSRRSSYERGRFLFEGRYRPTEPLGDDRGELEDFLTERYVLFSADRSGTVYRAQVHHEPWDLFGADYERIRLDIRGHPRPPEEPPASVLFSPSRVVKGWLPRRVPL